MQEIKDHVTDPSQVSVSGQGDSPSVFLHSSKLRNKLEKLAQWRIDPSLIEFPLDSREFSGGFAKVSRGLLASPFRAKGGTKKSEHITDEHLSSVAGNIESDKDSQGPGDRLRSKDEGVDGRTADGDNDHKNGERSNDNDAEQKLCDQTSMLEIGDGSGPSESIVNEDPDLGNHNLQPQSGTQESDGDQKGKDEETDRHIADDDNGQTKERTRKESDSSNEEQYSSDQTSQPKIVAVKKFKIEADTDIERVLGLALRESEFLIELSHSNIVKLEGFVEDLSAQKVWLIFPWEEYGNLRDFLGSAEWEIPERISLINDVTLGLEYLHSQNPPIYHGDLKSLNILVNSEFRALITDFGSARRLGDDRAHPGITPKENEDKEKDDKPPLPKETDPTTSGRHLTLEAFFSATASTLTLTGSSYTLRWAAPELLQDDKPCLRSDIWALGWVAYEVMTNIIPFQDIKKDAIVVNRVIQGHLPSVTEDARMSLIRALCFLMVQCWSLNPEKRPTAEECRKSISWMPMIVPALPQTIDGKVSQLRHARLLNQLGNMCRKQHDYLNALSCFTEAISIYTTSNDSRGQAETLAYLADVHRVRNEYTEATRFYSEALQIYNDLGNESGRASVIFGLAETHSLRDQYDEALKLYSEYLELSTSTGNQHGRASALWGLATVHKLQAEYSEAINLYSEALQVYTDVGDQRERALTLWGLADLHRYQGEYSEAINLYSEAVQVFTDVGDHKERALNLWSFADVYRFQHRYSEASTLYLESLQIYSDIGNKHGRASSLWGLAELHRTRYEYDDAITLYSEAVQLFTDVGDEHWRAGALMDLAATNEMRGHSTEAISLYTKASEVLKEIGKSDRASRALEKVEDIRKALEGATADSVERAEVGSSSLMASG